MKRIFTILCLLIAFMGANSQTGTNVVISQVYGGGGNSGSVYKNDFIELFNPTASPINLNGWSVQYTSSTGATWSVTSLTNFNLQPGQYYLVQQAAGTGGTTNLPTPDAIGTLAMSGTSGKAALVNSTTALSGVCPTGFVDLVGFGGATCFETAVAPAPSNTNSISRASNGCTDANNNSIDFSAGLPNPRNSSTALNPCGAPATSLSASPNISGIVGSVGTASAPSIFNLSGNLLTGFPSNITVTASADLEVSLTSGSGYATSILVPYTSATLSSTPIYTRIAATAPQGAINGTVTSSGGGAAANAVVTVTGAVNQNYYNTKSNAGLTNVATWSTTTDGTGASPADFVTPYQFFNIINQTNANYSGVWNVSNAGNTARVIVGNGINPITLTVLPGIDSLTSASRVDVLSNGTLIIQNNTRPFLNNLATGSTVDFAQSGTTTSDTIKVAALSYHHLKLTGGIKILSGGVTTVRGDLTVDAVQNFNGAPSPFSTINSFGNLTFLNGTTFEPVATGDANRFTLSMNGSNGEQYINGNGTEIFLFRLGRDTISSDMDIFLGVNTNLTLGNAIGGGGLRINQGAATFTNLISTGNTIKFARGAVSTATSNGKLNTNNTNIVVEKANGTTYAGILRFAPSSTLNNFTLNFDAAITKDSIAIADDIVINGALSLTKGRAIVAAGKSIDMANGSTLIGGNTTSFIEGTLKRAGINLLFPVGKGTNYAPIQLANMTGTNAYSVDYSNTGYGNYTIDPATLATYPAYNVSKYLYWNIIPEAAGSTDITFNYTDASSTVLVPNQIRIAHFDNTDWDDLGGTSAVGNTTTGGSITVTGVNTFSPFTFGAIVDGVLPVKLSSFAVQKSGITSRISWTTSQEINSAAFVIERSANGSSWTTVGTVNAAGNSTVKLTYSFIDNAPAKGINFYRLKLVDADNRFSNSDIKSVLFSSADVVLITPNPASSFVNIYMSKNNNSLTQIIVTDANGKMIERISTAEQTYQLKTSGYAKGLYIIKIAGAENTSTQKVIIQ